VAPFGGVAADKYGRARMVGITDFLAGAVLLIQTWYLIDSEWMKTNQKDKFD
jgi:hypothetical protein